jgi:hypothetical protein
LQVEPLEDRINPVPIAPVYRHAPAVDHRPPAVAHTAPARLSGFVPPAHHHHHKHVRTAGRVNQPQPPVAPCPTEGFAWAARAVGVYLDPSLDATERRAVSRALADFDSLPVGLNLFESSDPSSPIIFADGRATLPGYYGGLTSFGVVGGTFTSATVQLNGPAIEGLGIGYVQSIVEHELGHAVGLDHDNARVPYNDHHDVMAAFAGFSPRRYGAADVEALQGLYGVA